MKKLLLSNSEKVALVDDEDFELLNEERWQLQPNGAVARCVSFNRNCRRTIYLHRVIMDAPDSVCIDHANHDKLDNRKSNLRIASKSQNGQNQLKQTQTRSSKFKGVYHPRDCRRRPWRAYITVSGRMKFIGSFRTEIEAAKSYNRAARKHFGEFALLNAM